MVAITTLSAELLALFRKFRETADRLRSANSTIPIISVWREALDGDSATIFRTLGIVQSTIRRTSEEISSCQFLDDDAKDVTLDVVKGLEVFADPDSMHKNAFEFINNISSSKFGILSVTSNTLKQQYPEPKLPADDLEEIHRQLTEIGTFVNQSRIDTGLKALLLGHLAYMDFAIRNVSILGIEAIFQAFAPAVLSARQIAVHETANSDEDDRPKKVTLEKMKSLFNSILSLIDKANKMVTGLNELEDGTSGWLPPS